MRVGIVALLVVAVGASGCAAPHRLHRSELNRLDGFFGEDAVALRTIDGNAVAFSRDSRLVLVLRGGEEITHRYSRVEVGDGIFRGAVDGTGARVSVTLEEIADLRLWSGEEGEGGTVALMVLTMWLLAGALGLIGWAIYENSDFDDVDLVIVSY